jgi:hypothetical protein
VASAYILIRFRADTDLSEVLQALKQPGIESIDLVMGPYDAIVKCQAPDFRSLGEIAKTVRGLPGIAESMTCPVV